MKKPLQKKSLNRDEALSQAESHVTDLPGLMIEAERVAATVAQGIHGRRRTGQGESFWQYRPFQEGDNAAQIDWRRSARSDSYFVRETEWEASQTVWFWRDSSPSMWFRSQKGLPGKFDRATVLTLGLAILLTRSGERIGLMEGQIAAGTGKAALHRLADHLTLGSTGKNSRNKAAPWGKRDESLPEPMALPPYGQVVLISDFLAPIEDLARSFEQLVHRRQSGLLWMVSDPAEEALPYKGRVRFTGLEGEGELLVRKAQNLREEYQEKRAAHYAALRDLASHHGWHWLEHRTDMPAEAALMAAYQALSHDQGGYQSAGGAA